MDGNKQIVNSYFPIPVPSKQGNPAPFINHLERILPDKQDRAIVLAYMAAIVQHRGIKFQWAPLIQGAPGNGKSLLSRCIIQAIGIDHCYLPNAQQLTDKFNDWIDEKIFIAVEDVYVPHDKREVMEALKPMITGDTLEVQGKGTQKVTRRICANFIMNSNHKGAVIKSRDDRRFAMFFCAQQTAEDIRQHGMGGTYFPVLYDWLRREGYAIVTDYLQHYVIPDELNPAKLCQRAPLTSSTAEAISESQGTIEQEICAAIGEDRIGFRGGWISSHYLSQLISDCGMRTIPRNKRRDILVEMGYIPHPGLRNGQVDNAVAPDGAKSTLYVKADHGTINQHGLVVSKAYTEDQGGLNLLRVVA
jgi:hypothetical protein